MKEHRLPPRRVPEDASRTSGGTVMGAPAFKLGPPPGVPGEVPDLLIGDVRKFAGGLR